VTIAHLGVRTPWSITRGASGLDALCAAAQRRGVSSLAFADRNSLAGAVPAWNACVRAGIRPVLGAELVARGRRCWVFARDLRGYAAVCAAVTQARLDPDFDPVVQVRRSPQGIAALSDDPAVLRALQPYLPARSLRVAVLPWAVERGAAVARHLGLEPAAVGDAHFASPADHRVHRLLRARALRLSADAVPDAKLAPVHAWLAGEDVVRESYARCPAALHGAARLVQDCTFDLSRDLGFGHPRFPRVGGTDAPHRTLAARCRSGLGRLVDSTDGAHGRRLERELAVIGELGFAPYFVMLGDLVDFCRRADIAHCGRGSAAGSVVAWSLGLTQVDPLEHDLLFERFLSRARGDLPDVDLDLDWRRRRDVIDHLVATHGADRVAGVATHVRYGARGAVREMGRALGVPVAAVDRLSRALAHQRSLDEVSAAEFGRRHGLAVQREPYRSLLAAARAVADLPRHMGLHPSGVVVGARPLSRSIPLFRSASGVVATQWDGAAVQAAGWVKLDLLGNRSLGVLHDLRAAPAGEVDAPTRELVRRGDTVGCFHLESPAVRNLLRRMDCAGERDVIAASAVVRPGVAASGMLRVFLERRAGRGTGQVHPDLVRALPATHGVVVFQEDVMRVAQQVCGFSLSDADALRRALVRRGERARLSDFRDRFVRGAVSGGLDGASARALWDQVASFAGYAFCRAHAASFARVGLLAARAKAHDPAAFLAAVLSNGGGFYHPSVYVSECRRAGLQVLPPCVQHGAVPYSAHDRTVRVGLMQVRALSADTAARLVEQRELDGPFRSPADLVARVGISDREMRSLDLCGALDALPDIQPRPGPARLMDEIETLGVGVSGHPMDLLVPFLPPERVVATDLLRLVDCDVVAAGWPVAARALTTGGGRPMELVTFEDETGLMDAAVFPDVYDRVAALLSRRVPCRIHGRVDARDGVASLRVSDLRPVALPEQNAVA